MDETLDLPAIHEALVRQWGTKPLKSSHFSREALIEELARRVGFLLRHDLDRLMSALYILDVPEEKFAGALRRPPQEKPERLLAELILEREIEKMESRRRYTEEPQRKVTGNAEEFK